MRKLTKDACSMNLLSSILKVHSVLWMDDKGYKKCFALQLLCRGELVYQKLQILGDALLQLLSNSKVVCPSTDTIMQPLPQGDIAHSASATHHSALFVACRHSTHGRHSRSRCCCKEKHLHTLTTHLKQKCRRWSAETLMPCFCCRAGQVRAQWRCPAVAISSSVGCTGRPRN